MAQDPPLVNNPAEPPRRFAEVVLPEAPRESGLRSFALPSTLPAPDLGPLSNLPGLWVAKGTGWNLIALPFQNGPSKFRLLMNQYDEELKFTFVDDDVKNRGLIRPGSDTDNDQRVAALDYQQAIKQVAADDFPRTDLAGAPGLAIHHEPGLWLFEKNRRSKEDVIKAGGVDEVELTVARLASVPHGNSVLALGFHEEYSGMPEIPPISALPSGRFEDLRTPDYDFKSDPYLAPYLHYIDNPFKGNVTDPLFPGFNPVDMNELLRLANEGVDVVKTTVLNVDTMRRSAGITNVPFSIREAEPVSMKSTFWIQELAEKDEYGLPKLRLQYSQVVVLNFFHPREDELPGKASWPHISIATLEKVPSLSDYRLQY